MVRISGRDKLRLQEARCKFTTLLVLMIVVAVARVNGQVSNNATANFPQQQQQQADSLQAHLSQIQQQVRRQLSQFNGLMMNAASGGNGANSTTNRAHSNVLEAISNVGKVIQQQISAASNPNHVNIVTSNVNEPASFGANQEFANNKKNEYQSVQMAVLDPSNTQSNSTLSNANYREQGELLRQEIKRRAGQLQQVVAGSMDLLKNNGDLIMRRLLEQMNIRLDQAKAKADKIISNEPIAMNEMTVRTLATINSGLNNLNNIIANIVARIDSANKQDQQRLLQANSVAGSTQNSGLTLQQRVQQATGAGEQALPPLLDTSRFKANLHQLSQQFQQALNGSSLHQQLALIRNQRLQQQQQQQQLTPTSVNVNRLNTDFTQAKQQQ